jgi:hypothetical protein
MMMRSEAPYACVAERESQRDLEGFDKELATIVGVKKARQQELEATIENPLNMPLEAIPDNVNSLNGFNEVCC